MYRAHTQSAPPQSSSDIDLPLFDLSLGGDDVDGEKQPAASKPSTSKSSPDREGQPSRSLFDAPLRSEKSVSQPIAVAPSPSLRAAPVTAAAASSSFRRPSPAPVIIESGYTDSSSAECSVSDGELFQTAIPLSSFASTVASAAFNDRCEFEVEMLQQMASTPEQMALLYTEATTNPAMMKKNRYTNVIPSQSTTQQNQQFHEPPVRQTFTHHVILTLPLCLPFVSRSPRSCHSSLHLCRSIRRVHQCLSATSAPPGVHSAVHRRSGADAAHHARLLAHDLASGGRADRHAHEGK
jgi:hypothetical protein